MEKSWSRSPRSVQGSRSRQLMLCDECKNALDNDYAYSYYDCSCFYEDNTCTNHTVITCVAEHWLWRRINRCVQGQRDLSCRTQVRNLKNVCITFVQRWTNVEDVGSTLYKCYTIFLCLLGSVWKWEGQYLKVGPAYPRWTSCEAMESNVYWRHNILTFKVDPRTERIKNLLWP